MQIGFVGLGRMGQGMVARLLDVSDYRVMVWNRTAARAQPLVEQGATQAASLPELASACDVVFTILTDDAAVEAVYSPTDGLLAGNIQDTLLVEMSTIQPNTIVKLVPLVRERGGALLDSPISGGGKLIVKGQLVALVGGDEADLERIRPIMDIWFRQVDYIGPNGHGTMMKLAINSILTAYWQGLSEALAMGTEFGLDYNAMLHAIADSSAAIRVLPILLPVLLGEEDMVAFDLKGVRKDLLAITQTAQQLGVPTPAAGVALTSYSAATAAGWGDRDVTQLPAFYTDMVRRAREQSGD